MEHINFHPEFRCLQYPDQEAQMFAHHLDRLFRRFEVGDVSASKFITPWEKNHPDFALLEDFVNGVELIDRLYYVGRTCSTGTYVLPSGARRRIHVNNGAELFYRIASNTDKHIYVHLYYCTVSFDYKIYLTLDPEVYLKSIVLERCQPSKIWQSMVDDGLELQEPSELDYIPRSKWKLVPTLKFYCMKTVQVNHDKFHNLEEYLPVTLSNGLEQFMKVHATRDHHNSVMSVFRHVSGRRLGGISHLLQAICPS